MTRTTTPRPAAAGFTLFEVVVAMAIAALALVALFRAGSAGLFAVDTAGRAEQAIERAESHLAQLGRSDPITPGDSEGDDGGGYRWHLRVTPVAVQPLSVQPQNGAVRALFDVEVRISWHAGGSEKSVALDTRRIAVTAGSR